MQLKSSLLIKSILYMVPGTKRYPPNIRRMNKWMSVQMKVVRKNHQCLAYCSFLSMKIIECIITHTSENCTYIFWVPTLPEALFAAVFSEDMKVYIQDTWWWTTILKWREPQFEAQTSQCVGWKAQRFCKRGELKVDPPNWQGWGSY